MHKLDGLTPDIAQENIEQLKTLFPDVFEEGKIDFDKLKQVLGEYVDDNKERYNFSWNGKGQALRLAQTPSAGTLRPCVEESKNWDITQNLYIEGDNLEVLKLLQKNYHKKVKMIYIDPPYNTGKDFVYTDDFKNSIANYLNITGQTGEENIKISTNNEKNGRYHTDWLNMMYPRLRLARNLMKDDGLIFISIDDNEIDNLKKICDEIFGEDNYLNTISLNAKLSAGASGGGEDRKLKKNIEYILIYCKNIDYFPPINPVYKETELMEYIANMRKERKSFKYTNVLFACTDITYHDTIKDGANEDIDIYKVNTYEVKTVAQIARDENITEKDVYDKYFDKIMTTTNAQTSIRERVWDATDNENNMYIARYIPKSGKNKGQKIDLLFMGKQKVLLIWLKDTAVKKEGVIFKREKIGTYWDGFSWINVTKEGSIKFDNGKKPIALIQQMIDLIPDNEKMIVLDFFSGSASTAHAVLQNNATNDTHSQQRFIMIQLPEVIRPVTKDNLSYIDYLAEEGIKPVITEIGKERIRRAGEKIKGEAGLFAGDLDIGFKVFKLDSSNLKKWNPDYDDIEKSMYDSVDNYVDGRTEMDVVYEIMIKMGIELTQPVEERTIAGRKVYSVGKGALMMCLDDDITTDVAHGIVELKEEYSTEKDAWNVVFKDNGFASDSAKTNIKEIFKCADLKEDAFTTV